MIINDKIFTTAMKTIGVIFLFVLGCFVTLNLVCRFSNVFCAKLGELTVKTFKKLGLVKEYNPFWTSPEHREKLGIEIIEVPLEEKQTFHTIIEKIIKAGFRYYTSGNEEFEKVRVLFLPEEYARVKKEIEEASKERGRYKGLFEDCEIPADLPEIKFSYLRKYRDLENRIGIMSLVPINSAHSGFLSSGCKADQFHIFIFKEINGEWKIERIREVGGIATSEWLELEEEFIIKDLLKEKEG